MPHTWRKTEIGILQIFERLGLDTRRIFLFWSVAIGAVCGLVAVSFHLLIRAVTGLLFGAPDFAGVIRTPMTSVLIIFEMTQDYSIILPLMVANLVSLRLSTWLYPRGTYESLSLQEGVHLPTHRTRHILENIHVEDAMVREVIKLEDHQTAEEAIRKRRSGSSAPEHTSRTPIRTTPWTLFSTSWVRATSPACRSSTG